MNVDARSQSQMLLRISSQSLPSVTTTLATGQIATVTSTVTKNASASTSSSAIWPNPNTETGLTYIASVSGAQKIKRQSLNNGKYLMADGSMTSNASEAARLWINNSYLVSSFPGEDCGYYTDGTNGSMTLALKSYSVLTRRSNFISFTAGTEFGWNNASFANGAAAFALDSGNSVQAIFERNLPARSQFISLKLTKVDGFPVLVPSGNMTANMSTATTSPIQGSASPTEGSRGGGVAMTSSPSIPTFDLSFTASCTPPASSAIPTPIPPPVCSTTSISPSSFPSMIGLGIMNSSPSFHSYYTDPTTNSSYAINFPSPYPENSTAFALLDPASLPADTILFFQIPPSDPASSLTGTCNSFGYLFHRELGMCLTASTSWTALPLYQDSNISLQPCQVCGGPSPPARTLQPPEQLWCVSQQKVGLVGANHCMLFVGDQGAVQGSYGVQSYGQDGNVAVLGTGVNGGEQCVFVESWAV